MERDRIEDEEDLVRCLDCGTVYRQTPSEPDVRVCPNCGYVGWIAVSIASGAREQSD
jgi:predicted  nucleic acid-binding Zn-ribbon protein